MHNLDDEVEVLRLVAAGGQGALSRSQGTAAREDRLGRSRSRKQVGRGILDGRLGARVRSEMRRRYSVRPSGRAFCVLRSDLLKVR